MWSNWLSIAEQIFWNQVMLFNRKRGWTPLNFHTLTFKLFLTFSFYILLNLMTVMPRKLLIGCLKASWISESERSPFYLILCLRAIIPEEITAEKKKLDIAAVCMCSLFLTEEKLFELEANMCSTNKQENGQNQTHLLMYSMLWNTFVFGYIPTYWGK